MSAQALLGCDSFSDSARLDNCPVLRDTCQVFCTTSLAWDTSGAFLPVQELLVVWGATAQRQNAVSIAEDRGEILST